MWRQAWIWSAAAGIATLLVWVGSLAPGTATHSINGVAASLNAANRSRPLLTMTARNGGRMTVRLDSNTRILKAGKAVAASQIRAGDKLQVDYASKWGARIARGIVIESPLAKKPASQPTKKRR